MSFKAGWLGMMESDPPFHKAYKTLLDKTVEKASNNNNNNESNSNSNCYNNTNTNDDNNVIVVEECELPLIDLRRLEGGEAETEACQEEMARASRDWGFFQVVNHGISPGLLQQMNAEQQKLFNQSFDFKTQENNYFSAGTYRWGTPSATCLSQLSWSEAFHIPLSDISGKSSASGHLDYNLSSTMEQFSTLVSSLALKLAEILAEKLGHKSTFFQENCLSSTCYLRMNRYPPCPIPAEIFGLMPHTDSDFLTILHQDQVGGLQLVKADRWIAVKPNPNALIINIGDLFQAWSNNVYKSVQHRVVTNLEVERFSTAYFLCPSYETVIHSCSGPSVYKEFSFGEYRKQVQEDVKKLGSKIGLARFLV